MVIKNKDGSEYKLKRPNPLMKSQLLWDYFELHNMNFEEIKDLIKKPQILNNKKEESKKIIIEEEKETKTKTETEEIEEIEEIVKNEEPKEDIKKPTENNKDTSSSVKKTLIYCLPAKTSIYEDFLYGEVKKTISYDKKFKFEGVILNTTDISMELWTNAVEIEKESILYPQNFEKRWWKVIEINKKFDGYLITCSSSSITPSFEDL